MSKKAFSFFFNFLLIFSPQGLFSLVHLVSSKNAYCDFSSFCQDLHYVTIATFKISTAFCEREDLEVWGRAGSHHAQVTKLVYGSLGFEVRFCLIHGSIVPPTRRVCHFLIREIPILAPIQFKQISNHFNSVSGIEFS